MSLSDELVTVMTDLAHERGEERSPLIEKLLREHPLVQKALPSWRRRLRRADPLGSERRQRILDVIQQNPGVSKAELARLSGSSWGSIYHHLAILSKADQLLVERSARGKIRVYAANVTPRDRLRGLLTSSGDLRRLVDSVAKGPKTISQLSRELDVSRRVIRRQLSVLTEAGIVSQSGDYRPVFDLTSNAKQLAGGLT